jgi:hypothetical protein
MTDEQPTPPHPYQLTAYQLQQVTKTLQALDALTRETGVDLCALGDGTLGIDGVNVRYASTGEGRETSYRIDFSQY